LNRDFRIPAPFCLAASLLFNMSAQNSAFEAKVAQMWKESDEKWAERMAELQRQMKGCSPVRLGTVIAAGSRCDAAARTETKLAPTKVSPGSQKNRRRTSSQKRPNKPRRPTIVTRRRLIRRARPKPVASPLTTRRRPTDHHQNSKEPCLFWNLDALHMFCILCELDKQLCPYVRRCGRTVPPSSRGGHWLLPQFDPGPGALPSCLYISMW
jgi:hypothetical protein